MSRYDFTTEPLEYATKMLRGHILSDGLAKKFDLSQGVFYTYLPPQISAEEALKFTRGKRGEQRFRAEENGFTDPYDMVIADISSFLTQHRQSIFCVEDFAGRATDPWFTRKSKDDANIFVLENELYHYAFSQEASEDDVEYLLRCTEDWFYVGVLSILEEDISGAGIRKISEYELSAIIGGAKKIIFGAYERESFLIWEANDS